MATVVTHIIDPDNGPGTDFTSLSTWEADNPRNLITADEIDEAKCRCTGGTADGNVSFSASWTTDVTRYIRIYTDITEAYRHNGTFQTGNKFRISAAAPSSGGNINIPAASPVDIRIEGIAVQNTSTSAWRYGYRDQGKQTQHLYDNVFVGPNAGSNQFGVRTRADSSNNVFFRNNIVYDWVSYGLYIDSDAGGMYCYNNTIADCGIGIHEVSANGTHKARNNITQGNTTDWGNPGNWDVADSNISEDTTAPGTNVKISTVVTFENEAGNVFRLSNTDTEARNTGADLSADGDMAFAVDIIGTSRPQGASWDRGAHEAETTVTHIVDPDNGTDTDYTSLASWESAEARDLSTPQIIEQAECRCTGGTAFSAVTMSASWVTSSTYYVRIFTDLDDGYRHNGTYQTGNKVRVEGEPASGKGLIDCQQTIDIRIEGMAVKVSSNNTLRHGIVYYSTTAHEGRIYDNIVTRTGTGTTSAGIWVGHANSTSYVRNNICYDWPSSGAARAGIFRSAGDAYIYNNTCVDCGGFGINANSTSATVKARNNVVQGTSADGNFSDSTHFDAADSNLSEDATAPGTNAKTSTVVVFNDEASDDFRLDGSDTQAKDTGADLSADGDMPFAVDLIGTARPQGASWDRGAHETTEAAPSGALQDPILMMGVIPFVR
jgi:hypothetical protein